jgi:glutaconate CoA-transferase, subunit B
MDIRGSYKKVIQRTANEIPPSEMMAVAAAREIKDGDIVFCGTGISMLAAMAAKHISAPNSVIFFETGAIDSQLEEVPMAVGDPRVMLGAAVHGSLADAFAFMQNRLPARMWSVSWGPRRSIPTAT